MNDLDFDHERYGQYTADVFRKAGLSFVPGSKVLDVGCGAGEDCYVLKDHFGLDVHAIDIYEHNDISRRRVSFQQVSLFEYDSYEHFDYVFLHDVLHHLDEDRQSLDVHRAALQRLARIVRKGGTIVIIEGNRYNPIFYPHMVKMLGHEHFSYTYFRDLISHSFPGDKYLVEYKSFEAHFYPFWPKVWRIYEFVMENVIPKRFRAYNMVTIVSL